MILPYGDTHEAHEEARLSHQKQWWLKEKLLFLRLLLGLARETCPLSEKQY